MLPATTTCVGVLESRAVVVDEDLLQYDREEPVTRRNSAGVLLTATAAAAAAVAEHQRTPNSHLSAGDCAIEQTPFAYGIVKLTSDVCFGCGGYIFDRYLLQVGDQIWHVDCLRCCVCGLSLEQLPSCYVRDDRVHCKSCYQRHFGVKCARCSRAIQPTDWVRRARQFVYHLACFACDSCKRQLSTGEYFALQDSSVLCKQHYVELLEGDSGKAHAKQKTKRVRTTFSEEQLQILQANFQIDSNPDGQDLERIAQLTGLSKRVTQVWFQNSRARQKKYQGLKVKAHMSGSQTPNCLTPETSVEIACDDEDDDETSSSSPQPTGRLTSSLRNRNVVDDQLSNSDELTIGQSDGMVGRHRPKYEFDAHTGR